LIINEIMSNAFKYAFVNIAHPLLLIQLHSIDAKLFLIRIRDNGNGQLTNQHIEQEESFGLKLIRILSKQIHAGVHVTSEQGVAYELTLKK
jgi:two-component sensor histidine kinase